MTESLLKENEEKFGVPLVCPKAWFNGIPMTDHRAPSVASIYLSSLMTSSPMLTHAIELQAICVRVSSSSWQGLKRSEFIDDVVMRTMGQLKSLRKAS